MIIKITFLKEVLYVVVVHQGGQRFCPGMPNPRHISFRVPNIILNSVKAIRGGGRGPNFTHELILKVF